MESQIQEMGKTLFYDLFFLIFLYIPPPVDIYRHPLLTELDLEYSFNVWVQKMKSCVGSFWMIKILRFSRESSLFVLLQSIVRSISLIEAKRLYSCNNF